jgi:hypothetical protein
VPDTETRAHKLFFLWFLGSVSKKRMTFDQIESARRRAVAMFSNFGDSEGAAQFDDMTTEQYAEHKGIEVIQSNPRQSTRRSTKEMAKSKVTVELEDTVSDIFDLVQESGSTRADMQSALDQIADLCTDALPDLGESESENEDEADESEPGDGE